MGRISCGYGGFTVAGESGEFDPSCSCLVIKFSRSAVIDMIGGPQEQVGLTVAGQLNDGIGFKGTDTIRAIDNGK